MCTCTTIHTHTRMSGHSCSLYVWMCVRVYMCVTDARVWEWEYISTSYVFTLTQTHKHTIHVHDIHAKRHMYKCTMIHTNTRMSGRLCSFVCVDICTCVRVCYSMYVCVYVCMYLCMYVSMSHTCTLTQTHYTQYTYTTYMRRDTCVHVPKFIHTHA